MPKGSKYDRCIEKVRKAGKRLREGQEYAICNKLKPKKKKKKKGKK